MDYNDLEKKLLDAMKATLISQDVTLTDKNYKERLRRALDLLVVEKSFIGFTCADDVRINLEEGLHPEVVRKILITIYNIADENINKINEDEENEHRRDEDSYRAIDFYINSLKISEEYFKNNVKKGSIDVPTSSNYSIASRNARNAVAGGNFTRVKNSPRHIAGMQLSGVSKGKIRSNNQDCYRSCIHPSNKYRLMFVADGCGGHKGGGIASSIVYDMMGEWFKKLSEDDFAYNNSRRLGGMIDKLLNEIDEEIKKATGNEGATTLCFAIIRDNDIIMGNIGDSRGFIMEDGKLKYITHSDALLYTDKEPKNEKEEDYRLELSINKLNVDKFNMARFSRFHPENNKITKALGQFRGGFQRTVIESIPLEPGREYQVALCSDGVTDVLSDEDVEKVINDSNGADIAENLVKKALDTSTTFQEELHKCKVSGGFLNRITFRNLINYRRLKRVLKQYFDDDLSRSKAVSGIDGFTGKIRDDTTAISTSFRR